MRHLANQGALLMSSLALNGSASAGFVEYTNFAAWQSATAIPTQVSSHAVAQQ